MLEFYEDYNIERFLAAEKRYEKMFNMVGIGEEEYNKIVGAHDKRKAELYLIEKYYRSRLFNKDCGSC